MQTEEQNQSSADERAMQLRREYPALTELVSKLSSNPRMLKAMTAALPPDWELPQEWKEAKRCHNKKKLSQLNSGIDPEVMQDGITLAGYHIERGARTFAAYAKAMIEDLGDMVKPYLKSWYAAIVLDPRAAGFDGMDSLEHVQSADLDSILREDAGTGKPSINQDQQPDVIEQIKRSPKQDARQDDSPQAPSGDVEKDIAADPVKKRRASESVIERVVGDKLETNLPEVKHVTSKGKAIAGVIAKTLTKEQAAAIDKFTWRKDGGYFIRMKHVVRPDAGVETSESNKESRNAEQSRIPEQRRPEAGDGQTGRGDGRTGEPGSRPLGGGLAGQDATDGGRGDAAEGGAGASGTGTPSGGVRGEESMGRGDREPSTVRDRSERAAADLTGEEAPTLSTEPRADFTIDEDVVEAIEEGGQKTKASPKENASVRILNRELHKGTSINRV